MKKLGVLGLVCALAGVAHAQTQVKPRFLVIFDTSGSMTHTPQIATLGIDPFMPASVNSCSTNANCDSIANTFGGLLGDQCSGGQCHVLDGVPTHGDGSVENPGCDENGDGLFNDSKMFQGKGALLNAISAFGQVEWGLETYFQTAANVCDTSGSSQGACNPDWISECGSNLVCNNTFCGAGINSETPYCNGWQIPNTCAGHVNALGATVTCSTGSADTNHCQEWNGVGRDATGACVPNSGLVRVPFPAATDNLGLLASWMNNTSADGQELRGIGATPLAGSLTTAKQYLQNQVSGMPLTDSFVPCRNYSVILITDGAETCNGNPATAASALRSTQIALPGGGTTTIDVKTYVIGFALCPGGGSGCAAQQGLNAIASAGGTGSAFTATNGTDIELALAQIVQGSILVEHCNNVDDNCNNVIDEGYDKGMPCTAGVGACLRTGTKICGCNPGDASCDPTLGVVGRGPLYTICSATPGAPSTEICNGLDDDCNGVIDDVPGGCPTCTPQPEVCNGLDDDCDGIIDNPNKIFPCPSGTGSCPPPCGLNVGQCTPGTLACVGGNYVCQGGTGPSTEVCDGRDNDCDGVIDGISRACYPAGTPGCNLATGMCQGICLLGTQTCPRLNQPASSNSFGACMGAVTPQTEICNGLDDDCNGIVDDVPGGCGNSCIPMPEICNGRDDNCNGIVDDNPMGENDPCWTFPPPAMPNVGPCRPGHQHCINGMFQCQGQIGPTPEICDGIDNDCDGMIDNGATCPPMYACINGACQPACSGGEFPCAPDRICVDPNTHQQCTGNLSGCYCLPSPCATMQCPAGQRCVVTGTTGMCVDPCANVQCPAGTQCVDGRCSDCTMTGCPSGERCVGGACQTDPCAGVQCAFDQFCRDGMCVASCMGITCPAGQSCVDGQCQNDPCVNAGCPEGQICNQSTGRCENPPCAGCMPGYVCNGSTGACEPDPCGRITCGSCEQCVVQFSGAGTCAVNPICQPGAAQGFTQTGGGGCTCEVSGHATAPPFWLLLIGLAALARRRR